MKTKFSIILPLVLLLTISNIQAINSVEKSVQESGNLVDIDFSNQTKIQEIENLIALEDDYNKINSDISLIFSQFESTLLSLQKLQSDPEIAQESISTEIRKNINLLDSISKTQLILKNIPVNIYTNPIELANSLLRIDTTDRPEIINIKLPESVFGPIPTLNEKNNQQIFLTWEMTIKTKNLIDQINVSSPPNFRPWGFIETNKNVDNQFNISFITPEPQQEGEYVVLKSRKFVDGWVYETYLGKSLYWVDPEVGYFQFEARTNKVKLSTCPVFILINQANSQITRLPDSSLCQSKLQNITFSKISREKNTLISPQFDEIKTIWKNRIKFNDLSTRISTYHELGMELKIQLEKDINDYKKIYLDLSKFIEIKILEAKNKRLEKQKNISNKTIKIIFCVKGKLTKKVTGINPKCPIGYKTK